MTKLNQSKLLSLMEKENLDGILLARRDSFSWFTSGRYNHVLLSTEIGIAYLYITRKNIICITSEIEKDRLLEEELFQEDMDIVTCPWYKDLDTFASSFFKGKVGSDDGRAGTIHVLPQLKALRASLSEDEITHYYSFGQKSAEIVENVCRNCRPGMTEHEISGLVAKRCIAEGIEPVCLLVAADERIDRYKHPIPTQNKLKDVLMIVLGAQYRGLNISLTRFVQFGKMDKSKYDKVNSLANIHAQIIHSTVQGVPYKTIFENAISAYKMEGYEHDWKLHHQGGPTGYSCREEIISLDSEGIVLKNQAFAFNPSLKGIKSEDTFVVKEEGCLLLTRTASWPIITCVVEGKEYAMADVLIR
ncbi:M24 family metallopeptidase [Virgibacillus pantothenticus]|uniref:M24 family metallopeptidase n=1 Tax=Virgibacillus pantothenticus TaxID=1473 RepID=UPI0009853273|nr:M24 family metallopeptidase [Virgibacillus pantothenticus]